MKRRSVYKTTTEPERIPWHKCLKNGVLTFFDRIYWALNQPLSLKIAVIGPENCGKTSIIRRFAGDIFYDEKMNPEDPTFRFTSLMKIRNCSRRFNVKVIEVDRKDISKQNYDELLQTSAGILLVYSVEEPEKYGEVLSVIDRLHIRRKPKDNKKEHQVIVALGNKTEICTNLEQVNQNTEMKDELQTKGVDYFSVSAKSNWGISEAVNELIEQSARNKVMRFSSKKKNKSKRPKKNGKGLLSEDENGVTFDEL
eukprot:TCONS_00060243-protein